MTAPKMQKSWKGREWKEEGNDPRPLLSLVPHFPPRDFCPFRVVTVCNIVRLKGFAASLYLCLLFLEIELHSDMYSLTIAFWFSPVIQISSKVVNICSEIKRFFENLIRRQPQTWIFYCNSDFWNFNFSISRPISNQNLANVWQLLAKWRHILWMQDSGGRLHLGFWFPRSVCIHPLRRYALNRWFIFYENPAIFVWDTATVRKWNMAAVAILKFVPHFRIQKY